EATTALRDRRNAGKPINLVIIDRLLPDADGKVLLEAIRRDKTLAETAVVLMSTASQVGEAELLKRSGADAVLFKPVRHRQFRQVLARLLAAGPPLDIGGRTETVKASRSDSSNGHLSLRVLIVEDNFVNQKVIQRHMEKLGHRADVAGNGAEALDT